MLMKRRREPEVRHLLAELVEGSQDVVFVCLEIVRIALYTIRADDDYFAMVFTHERGPGDGLGDGVLARGGVGEVGGAVGGDERQVVLFQQGADSAVGLHGFDLISEKLDSVEAEGGNVGDGCLYVLRI